MLSLMVVQNDGVKKDQQNENNFNVFKYAN